MKHLALVALLPALALAAGRDFRSARDARDSRGSSNAALRLLANGTTGYDSASGNIYTASGVAVTFTRASTRTCTEPTTGVIRSLASGAPCVTSAGLSMEPSATNVVTVSEDLTNAAWVNWGSSAPTVTHGTWDFGRGSATGDTISDADATSQLGRNFAYVTSTAGTYTGSCYFQAGTLTSAQLRVQVNGGGTGSTTCTFSGLSATATGDAARKSCSITAAGTVTSLNLVPLVGTAASDTGSIKVGGCQLETGSVATSYIPTTGTTATRAAETATVPKPASLSLTEGCACVSFTPSFTGNAPGIGSLVVGNGGATSRLSYVVSGQQSVGAYDGTHFATRTTTFTAGTKSRYCSRWSVAGGYLRGEDIATGTNTQTAFTGFPSFDSTLYVGSLGASGWQPEGSLSDIVLGTTASACQ